MDLQNEDQNSPETPELEADAPSAADLDAFSEFTFQGEKFTPESLADIVKGFREMNDLDSTYNKEVKYYHNLDTDLKAVRENPQLADKFKSVYPQKFHAYLDYVLKKDAKEVPAQTHNLPKEWEQKLSTIEQKIKEYEQGTYQSQVEAAQAQLDQTLEKLKTKYPNADDDVVLAKAEVLASQGHKITQGTWERLVKQSHESFAKRAAQYQKTLL